MKTALKSGITAKNSSAYHSAVEYLMVPLQKEKRNEYE